jgi:hypothetical protein
MDKLFLDFKFSPNQRHANTLTKRIVSLKLASLNRTSCESIEPGLHSPGGGVSISRALHGRWRFRTTGDPERIASHAQSTFWYVLPSLPMFLVLPAMLRAGLGFWPRTIPISSVATTPSLFWKLMKNFGIASSSVVQG